MATTIRTSVGEFSGRNADTIIRREWGRDASLLWATDRNDPNVGSVVVWRHRQNAWQVLAKVHSIDDGKPDTAQLEQAAVSLQEQIRALEAERAEAQAELAETVRALKAAGWTWGQVGELLGMTGPGAQKLSQG